jgi:DNA sulfur modification protein DndD
VRINRVILQNYGLYSSRAEFDLVPRPRGKQPCPIILVGGMNGAGKTTLLDGVRLALYGKNAVGERLSQKAYEAHLRGLIHRSKSALIQVDEAFVGLEFELVARGNRETYYVQRSWKMRSGEGAEESLSIQKKPLESDLKKLPPPLEHGWTDYSDWPKLEDIDPQYLQDFLNDVVPERLSQLFFFDGEKIKRIADDISGDAAIADAIRSLLGLDTVDTLKSDLGILSNREAKKFATAAETANLAALEQRIEQLSTELDKLYSETHPIAVQAVDGAQAEVKRLEGQLREQGGTFAQARTSKQTRKSDLLSATEDLKRQIRQACEGVLPLAICPHLNRQLDEQIHFEQRARTHATLRTEVETLQSKIVKRLAAESAFKPNVSRQVSDLIQTTIAEHFGADESAKNSRSYLGLSEADAARVQGWLTESVSNLAPQTQLLCDKLEAAERELANVEGHLKKAPEQAVLEPIFADLSAKYAALATAQSELKTLDEKIASLTNQLASQTRARDELLLLGKERAHAVDRVALLGNIQTALDKYLQRLTQVKIDTLCKSVADCFNHLSRKGDVLHSVSINPKSFEVTMRDHSGHVLPREELSAGEKQILAISILWALSKTSGRPLPVIIDTPLGRLDSHHRSNLVENYFPHAGHQVVLLSTDTEVDKPLFDQLKPHVSHCHHLIFDKAERRTHTREEYFWKE